MSLDRKSIHVRLSPDMHQRLAVMAEFQDKDVAELAARLLEKGIAGEWHEYSLLHARMNRLGRSGILGD